MLTEERIFELSLAEICPCCGNDHVDEKYQTAETVSGGKTMAYYMRCPECASTWRVGLNRRSMPIKSKIINNKSELTKVASRLARNAMIGSIQQLCETQKTVSTKVLTVLIKKLEDDLKLEAIKIANAVK